MEISDDDSDNFFGTQRNTGHQRHRLETDDSFVNGKKTDNMDQASGGTFVGTPLYVSPEMLQHNLSGFYTDLWSLGCIIFEMHLGYPPFQGINGY
jgi:serine/threonine protein kinase